LAELDPAQTRPVRAHAQHCGKAVVEMHRGF
jgi:hypothetical protein